MLVKNLLPKLAQRQYTALLFLFALLISIVIISANITNTRDDRLLAADSGSKNPGLIWTQHGGSDYVDTCNGSGTDVSWSGHDNTSNPGGADAGKWSDNNYLTATANASVSCTRRLFAWNFGFSIPSNATINGVQVNIERKTVQNSSSIDEHIQLTNGFILGNPKGGTGIPNGTDTVQSFGGPTDKWGANLTPDTINKISSGRQAFGFEYQAKLIGSGERIEIDSISMTVFYTIQSTPPPDPEPDPKPNPNPSPNPENPSDSGVNLLPSPPTSIPGTAIPIDPEIVNLLKLEMKIPYLIGKLKAPILVGGFNKEIEIEPGKTKYELDVRGAKFKLGSQIKIEAGGFNTLLTKKVNIKSKAPRQPVNLGNLILGDVTGDNRINADDTKRYLEVVLNGDILDVNGDTVANAFDWAVILANFDKKGD